MGSHPGDDDELELPPLPPLPPLGADEEALGDDVGDDGLAFTDEGESNLDDSEGIEGFDAGAFLDGMLLADETPSGKSLLDDAPAELGDLGGLDDAALESSAESWIGDPGPGLDDDVLGDFVDAPSGALAAADEGEGPGDEAFDLPPLPPLAGEAADGDDGDESLDLGGLEELAWAKLGQEVELRLDGRSVPPPVHVRTLHWVAAPVVAADLAPDGVLFAVGDEVWRGDADGSEARPARGLEAEELVSVAPVDADRVVVGTRLGGVYRSLDGGRSFEPANGWRSGGEPTVPCHVLAAGERVWLWAGGALYRSDDLAGRWTGPLLPHPVLDLARDGADATRIVALGRVGERLRLARAGSTDAQLTVTDLPVPPSGFPKGALGLAAHGARWMVWEEGAASGPWWSGDPAAPVGEAAGALAGLFDGAGRPCFALHAMRDDRALLLRGFPPAATLFDRRGDSTPSDPEGAHRLRSIRRAGDVLLLACTAGLFVLEDVP